MDADNARNLTYHRAVQSVWDKRGWKGVAIEERVGPLIVSLAGAVLLGTGLRRRSWRGTRLLGGALLISCAATGLCNPRHAAIRLRHLKLARTDRITTESMDSFPASDAPSSNATTLAFR